MKETKEPTSKELKSFMQKVTEEVGKIRTEFTIFKKNDFRHVERKVGWTFYLMLFLTAMVISTFLLTL